MKKPRLLTARERAEWAEHNRETKRRVVSCELPVASEDGVVSDVGSVPPPVGGRLGGVRSGHAGSYPSSPRVLGTPPPQPSPSGGGSKAPLKPLKPLTPREAKRVFKTAAEVTLDLHGMGKLDAYARVQQCVMRAHCAGRRHVAIITGKGRLGEAGVLRSNLPHWLNEPALRHLVSAFAYARAEKGGEGVTHVLLKRA